MTAPLIVVTGPDGSGKSTACAGVAAELERRLGAGAVAVAGIWDSMLATGAFEKNAVVRYLATLKGAARTLFLFHAMRHSLDLARDKAPRLLLVDSYFYKYAAAELAYGTPAEIVRGAAVGFERPALTVWLELAEKEALARKTATSRYESGGGERRAPDFERFQKAMRRHWHELEVEHGPWSRVISDQPREAVVAAILAEIERACPGLA